MVGAMATIACTLGLLIVVMPKLSPILDVEIIECHPAATRTVAPHSPEADCKAVRLESGEALRWKQTSTPKNSIA